MHAFDYLYLPIHLFDLTGCFVGIPQGQTMVSEGLSTILEEVSGGMSATGRISAAPTSRWSCSLLAFSRHADVIAMSMVRERLFDIQPFELQRNFGVAPAITSTLCENDKAMTLYKKALASR